MSGKSGFSVGLIIFSIIINLYKADNSYTSSPYSIVNSQGQVTSVIRYTYNPPFNVPGLNGLSCPQYNTDQRGSFCWGLNTAYNVKKNSWQECSNQCYYSKYTWLGLCQQFTYDYNNQECYIKDGDTSCTKASNKFISAHNPTYNIGDCATTCVVSQWSEWTPCPTSCNGLRSRTREISQLPIYNTDYCPNLIEYANCNTDQNCPPPCPQYGIAILGWGCQMNQIFDFNPNIKLSYEPNWKSCRNKCIGDTLCVAWSYNSTVDATDSSISNIQYRLCYTHRYAHGCMLPAAGWISGYPESFDTDCPQGYCNYSEWSQWSTCSNPCSNTEQQQRTRDVLSSSSFYWGVKSCENQIQSRVCSQGDKSILSCEECLVSSWSDWSTCSSSCIGGSKTRKREVTSKGDGKCPELNQTTGCNDDIKCSEKCNISEWSNWSICSTTCGEGKRYRSRNTVGSNCPESSQNQTCNLISCGKDPSSSCDSILTHWSSWSECLGKCGNGEMIRTRGIDSEKAILKFNMSSPLSNDDLNKIETICNDVKTSQEIGCNTGINCNCKVGEWSTWGNCNCNSERNRTRTVIANNSSNSLCPTNIQLMNCTKPSNCEGNISYQTPGQLNIAAAVGTPVVLLSALATALAVWFYRRRRTGDDIEDEQYEYLEQEHNDNEDEFRPQQIGPEDNIWAES